MTITHRKSGTKEHEAFMQIRKRCNNPNHAAYHNYGGRDIKCLYSSFEEFLADVGPAPTPEHTIDRIDNAGDYTPGNCRWATRREQQNNRRSNCLLTHDGMTMSEAEWCRHLGFKDRHTIAKRRERGWTGDDLFEPLPVKKAYYVYWHNQCGVWVGSIPLGRGKQKYICREIDKDAAILKCQNYLQQGDQI